MFLLPNLIIPGAPKSATTSLCEYFKPHNDIFVPKIKEPRFFIEETIQNLPQSDPFREYLINSSTLTLQAYEDIYKESGAAKYRCDASVHYLYYHDFVIPGIKKYIKDATIIIVLRNPVDRAFSNYTYLKSYDNHSFEEELDLEKNRKEEGWNSFWFYVGQGFYYEQVIHYMNEFTKVKVVLMDDINKNGNAVMDDIFDFLDVKRIDIDTSTVHNKSGVPRNKFVEWLVFNDNFLKTIPRYFVKKMYSDAERERLRISIHDKFLKKGDVTITNQTHNDLIDVFSEDILRLQDLIQKDISGWLKKK